MNFIIPLEEMKPYWALLRKNPYDATRVNTLILILKINTKNIKFVRLPSKDVDKHLPVERIKPQNLKISGVATDEWTFLLEDYLTSSSEVIRAHATALLKQRLSS